MPADVQQIQKQSQQQHQSQQQSQQHQSQQQPKIQVVKLATDVRHVKTNQTALASVSSRMSAQGSQMPPGYTAIQGNNYGYHLATMEVVDSYCKFGDNYAFSTAGITESKHQVSRDSNYGYMATTSSVADIELRKDTCYSKLISDNSEGKVQVSKSSNYAFMNAKEDKCSVYLFKGSASIDISTSDAQDKQIKLRSVDVCEGGTTKQMIILASEPF